jgi:hypothetical protein
MKNLRLALALAAFFSLLQFAAATAQTAVSVPLNEQNGSGESGTATLTPTTGGINVVIALKGAPATAQPAHIHDGTCADLKGVAHPLTNVVNGSSTTVVTGVTMDQLLKGPYAINVHESAANLGKYVACGNIIAPQGSM